MSTKGSKKSRRGIKQAFDALAAKGTKPNFLFIGDSVLHIAAFNAFVSYMSDNGTKMRGVVCNGIPSNRISQFDTDSITSLNEEDYILLHNGTDVDLREFPLDTITDAVTLLSTLLCNSQQKHHLHDLNCDDSPESFYLIFPGTNSPKRMVWNSAFACNRYVCRVITDEGIGTYNQTPKTWQKLSLAKTKSPVARFAKSIRWYAMMPAQKLQQKLMKTRVEEKRFCLFDQGNDGFLYINECCRKYLAEAFNAVAIRQNVSCHDYANTAVLVATVVFVEAGCPELEIDFYRPIVELLHQNGYKVVVRPHPRDKAPQRYRCLGVDLDHDEKVPFESLISVSKRKPALIAGLFSTVQVTANALWGIPTVVLSGWFSEYASGVDNERVAHFISSSARAVSTFSPFIEDVNDQKSLCDVLSSLHDSQLSDGSNLISGGKM